MSNRKRRQKKQHRTRKNQAGRGSVNRRAASSDPEVVELVSFEVTDEPMPVAAERNLSPELLDRLDALTEQVHGGSPGEHLDEIRAMLALCPQIPRLHNYLAMAYENLGQTDKARAVVEQTCQRFPDYVFGITNYVMYCLHDGDVEEAGRALNKRHAIWQFAKGRRKFHESEVICYQAAVGMYLCEIGEYEHAISHAEMLVDLDPEHPTVWRLLDKLYEHGQALLEAGASSGSRRLVEAAAG